MIDDPPKLWLTAREVACQIGVHVNSIKRIPANELSYMRFGARKDRRYREADVAAYIERRTVRE